MNPNKEHWILCPACGAKTRARLLPDTVLRNFPLFCPKCRCESIINVQNYKVSTLRICEAGQTMAEAPVHSSATHRQAEKPKQTALQPDA